MERTDVRRIALLTIALILGATLTACGSDEPETEPPTDQNPSATDEPTDDSTEEPTDDATTEGPRQIEITFEGSSAPQVERVQVDTGETIELVITSDAPGELHVHSDPEQTIDYKAGTTTASLTIDRPGVVEVERHEPEALVLQLEVR
jgi:predicted small lipoprotein YifL